MLKLQNLIVDALLEAELDQEIVNPNLIGEYKRLHDLEKGLAKAVLTLLVLESSFRDNSLIKLKVEIADLLRENKASSRYLTQQENVEMRINSLTSEVIKSIECLKVSKDAENSKRLCLLRLNLEKLMEGGAMCSQ